MGLTADYRLGHHYARGYVLGTSIQDTRATTLMTGAVTISFNIIEKKHHRGHAVLHHQRCKAQASRQWQAGWLAGWQHKHLFSPHLPVIYPDSVTATSSLPTIISYIAPARILPLMAKPENNAKPMLRNVTVKRNQICPELKAGGRNSPRPCQPSPRLPARVGWDWSARQGNMITTRHTTQH